MLLIWGFRSYVRSLAVLTLVCRNGHTAAHQVRERTRKFTLFFIPLFPVSRKRFTVCATCSQTVQLTKEQAAQLLQQVPGASMPAPPFAPAPVAPTAVAPAQLAPAQLAADTVVPAATSRRRPAPGRRVAG